jgi:hypothetical protein
MKTKHGILFGFAVLLLAAMFTMTACDNNTTSNVPIAKTIVITGIDAGLEGERAWLTVYDSDDNEVAKADEYITGGSVTLALQGSPSWSSDWTGSGNYYLVVEIDSTNYGYTLGAPYDSDADLELFNIDAASKTIAWTLFGEEPSPKTITITNIPIAYDEAWGYVHLMNDSTQLGYGVAQVGSNTLITVGFNTVPDDQYRVGLHLGSDWFYYTNGAAYGGSPYTGPKIAITDGTIIDFTKFNH